jgi:hypothetical protein
MHMIVTNAAEQMGEQWLTGEQRSCWSRGRRMAAFDSVGDAVAKSQVVLLP